MSDDFMLHVDDWSLSPGKMQGTKEENINWVLYNILWLLDRVS